MNGQTILTNFFTAAKSRQNTHPAKRRKVEVDIDFIPKKSAKLVDEKCVSSGQDGVPSKESNVARSLASSRAKQGNRSRSKSSKTRRKATQNKIVLEGVVSVTTSLHDDHESGRSRKQCVINNAHASSSETLVHDIPPAILKTSETESKSEQSLTEVANKTSLQSKSAVVPSNISSRSRTGLAINPWIAEQAKLVLASRGKQALERSLDRKKAMMPSSKVVKEKVTAEVVPKVKNQSCAVKPKVHVPRLGKGGVTTQSNAASAESSSKLPAYKRFSHLLEAKKPQQPSAVTKNLPLPYHFKVLEEMFRCVDVVLSLKRKRYETCTFEKLKDAVQEMCRKKFEKKHLAQMKAVYPSAFVFQQQSSSSGPKKSGHELTIDFNLDGIQEQKAKDFKFVESSVLISRQKHFKNELLKITMSHHRVYLANNYPSLTVDDNAIMRWHPCFPLDKVPEIHQLPLPEPPQVKTFSTAQDVLDQARQNMTPRVEKALNVVAKKSAETNLVKSNCAKTVTSKKDSSQSKNQNPSLKGISQSLIDKIRLKEEKKIQESLTVDSEVVQKRVMLQRLPELCRILKTYFVSERKAAIPLDDVSNKLAESYSSTLSAVQVEKHLKLLSEVGPEWLSIMYVRKCPYVKLKKNANIGSLIEKLKSKEVN